MKKLIFMALFALSTSNALASGEDLDNCRWEDGSAMYDSTCSMLRKNKVADDAANKQRQADFASGPNLETCHWNTGTAIDPERCTRLRIEKLEREYAEEQVLRKKSFDDFQRQQAREEATQKRKCGKDYMAIRIGMTIKRLDDCTGAAYINQTVTQDGVIETYRTMFKYVNVKNGKVISYTNRPSH